MTTTTPATAQLSLADRLAKARLAKAQKSKLSAVAKEISRFVPNSDDANRWVDLARERNVRLPQTATPCTTAGMTQWLRRLGLSVQWFYGYTGFTSLRQWIDHNPTWTLRSLVGLLLEEA